MSVQPWEPPEWSASTPWTPAAIGDDWGDDGSWKDPDADPSSFPWWFDEDDDDARPPCTCSPTHEPQCASLRDTRPWWRRLFGGGRR